MPYPDPEFEPTPPTTGYNAFCDDFYVNARLGSHLPMPHERGSVVHFLEQIQKAFPSLHQLHAAGGVGPNDMPAVRLEEDPQQRSYRWLSLESRQLSAGHVNPPSLEEVARLHRLILQIAPYQLGVSPVEIAYLDLLCGFDLEFNGDHEAIVAETMFRGSPLACLVEHADGRPAEFSPALTVAFDEQPGLRARLEIVTRGGNAARGGDEGDSDVIRVFLTLRRFWQPRPEEPVEAVYADLLERADRLLARQIVPHVLRPIAAAISSQS